MYDLPRTALTVAILALTVGTLAGCASYEWEKSGASQADLNRDSYECQMEAARTYPTAITQIPISSGYSMPTMTSCSGTGTAYANGNTINGNSNTDCVTSPGQTVAPVTVPIDVNTNNRANATRECFFARGYQLVRVK